MPTMPSEYYRTYYQKNKEKIRARIRAWSKSPKQKKKHAERARRHRAKLGDLYRAYERDRRKRRPKTEPLLKAYSQFRCRLRNLYRISEEEYWKLVQAQNNCCAGCLEEFEMVPHLDHNHETKEVRGILCQRCNSALGQVRDNAITLRRLADYLEKHAH